MPHVLEAGWTPSHLLPDPGRGAPAPPKRGLSCSGAPGRGIGNSSLSLTALLIKAFPLFSSSCMERARGMFNSLVQSWCSPHPPAPPSFKALSWETLPAPGLFPCFSRSRSLQLPFRWLLPPPAEGDLLFSSRNLLGTSEAGCKPRFSDWRRFQRPQFVELLHEYLMVIFLGRVEAKNEGVDYPVMPIRGRASPRWGGGCGLGTV